MKRIYLMSLVSTTLFMACTKVNNADLIANNSATKPGTQIGTPAPVTANTNAVYQTPTTGVIASGVINYQLLTIVPPNPLVQWNSGYISTSSIAFDGYQPLGNSFRRIQFETKTGQTLKLMAAADLGTVAVVPGNYSSASMSILLNPLGTAAASSAALYFSGNFKNVTGSNAIPVQLIVTAPLEMTTPMINNVIISNNQNYTASLLFDLAQMTNGITTNMLATAETTNGMILISANSNGNLYQIILSNLKSNLQVQFH